MPLNKLLLQFAPPKSGIDNPSCSMEAMWSLGSVICLDDGSKRNEHCSRSLRIQGIELSE